MENINSALIITLAFSLLLPIGLLIWWKKKTGEKLWCFIAGGICFLLFAYVLEALMHQYLLGMNVTSAAAITGSPLLYMLYASFAAGIFEETGRLFGYKVLLKNHREKECAVAYGIGHGGMEVLLILTATYAVYVLVQLGIQIADEATNAQMEEIAKSVTVGLGSVALLERVSALMTHIGLSMIVFTAAREKGKFWLYPAAICLHALADMPAALAQIGVISSIVLIEALAFVMGLALLLLGIRTLKGYAARTEQTLAEA